jgi:hypothetical protein
MTDFLIRDFVGRPHRLHLIGRGRCRHDPAAAIRVLAGGGDLSEELTRPLRVGRQVPGQHASASPALNQEQE